MKYIPGQDWQLKIEVLKRRITNRRNQAVRYTSEELTAEERERVESVTRFERRGSRILKQNWREPVVTNV